MITFLVMAKECRPGAVKTRLCPPYTPGEASLIAEACLRDTLDTLESLGCAPGTRRVLCIDGSAPTDVDGWEVMPQHTGSLDLRIGAALDGCCGPTLVVGMDTPQLSAEHLRGPLEQWSDDIDAWFGAATDGGFWSLGLRAPDGDVVRGVSMSVPDTGARQRERLVQAGLNTRDLVTLTDIDTAETLDEVSPTLADGHLTRLLAALRPDPTAADRAEATYSRARASRRID